MGCTIFMTTWVMLPPEGEKVAELLSAEPQCFFFEEGVGSTPRNGFYRITKKPNFLYITGCRGVHITIYISKGTDHEGWARRPTHPKTNMGNPTTMLPANSFAQNWCPQRRRTWRRDRLPALQQKLDDGRPREH